MPSHEVGHDWKVHKALPPDTSAAAFAVQMRLLRQSGPRARLERALNLSRFAIDASRQALRRRFPDESAEQLAVRWVRQHYGEALAAGVRKALADRA